MPQGAFYVTVRSPAVNDRDGELLTVYNVGATTFCEVGERWPCDQPSAGDEITDLTTEP